MPICCWRAPPPACPTATRPSAGATEWCARESVTANCMHSSRSAVEAAGTARPRRERGRGRGEGEGGRCPSRGLPPPCHRPQAGPAAAPVPGLLAVWDRAHNWHCRPPVDRAHQWRSPDVRIGHVLRHGHHTEVQAAPCSAWPPRPSEPVPTHRSQRPQSTAQATTASTNRSVTTTRVRRGRQLDAATARGAVNGREQPHHAHPLERPNEPLSSARDTAVGARHTAAPFLATGGRGSTCHRRITVVAAAAVVLSWAVAMSCSPSSAWDQLYQSTVSAVPLMAVIHGGWE